MADEAQVGSVLVSLLPVIVGGVIGVVGGLAGPPLSHWLTERSEKRKKRIDKFEEMMGAIYDHRHWLSVKHNIGAFGAPDTNPPSPFPKAHAIAAIYFPALKPALAKLDAAASQFELWIAYAAERRVQGKISEVNEGMMEAYQPYLDTFDAVVRSLRVYAMEQFKNK